MNEARKGDATACKNKEAYTTLIEAKKHALLGLNFKRGNIRDYREPNLNLELLSKALVGSIHNHMIT